MRAPAAAVKITSGALRRSASSAACTKVSPAAMLSEPAMKAKFCASTTASTPSMRPTAAAIESRSPVALRAAASAGL